MKILTLTALAAVLAAPTLALALDSTPRIDQRQQNQQQRIDQGVNSGALTDREAHRLQHGQQRVQNMEQRALADGKMSMKERARLEHAQDHQSKHIFGEKHDKQRVK